MPKSFDEESLKRELELTHDDVVELISDFRNYLVPALETIEKSMASGDFKTCRTAAHTLKGSAGNLRINAIHVSAKAVQEAADAANAARLKELLEQIKKEVAEFMQETANFS